MSTTPDPLPSSTVHRPVPVSRSVSSTLLGCGFALSFVLNLVLAFLVILFCFGWMFRGIDTESFATTLPEKFHSGSKTASKKVAVVSMEGVILEGTLGYVHKQLELVGKDDNVKAVVLRINSPGGSITASEDLYRKIIELRDGNEEKKIAKRPVVVSMASLAASGGYYISAPAEKIFAERSTITGSIGVYTSFPNIKEFSEKWGFTMNTIKAGAIKDSGSMFQKMTPAEYQSIQDMVDDAYVQFLDVVEKGRPKLTRAKMLERFTIQPFVPDPKAVRPVPPQPYERYRADGGIYTSRKALELGLVDAIGSLDDAVKAAATLADVTDYKAFKYEKTKTLSDLFLGAEARVQHSTARKEFAILREMFTPRIWYLAPGFDSTGIFAAADR